MPTRIMSRPWPIFRHGFVVKLKSKPVLATAAAELLSSNISDDSYSGLILMKKRRVMEVFPPSLRKLWKELELRAMAIISLLIQILLIVLGKRRRHIPDTWIRIVVWSAYLMADSIATIALGILSNDLGDIYDDGGQLEKIMNLLPCGHPSSCCIWVALIQSRPIPWKTMSCT
ncbi:hypothetical protein V6N13_088197 [Hibiscus sabdariffa]